MLENKMTAINCEFGDRITIYAADERIKEVVPRAAYYGYRRGHTIVLSPCLYKNADIIPDGYKYCHMQIGEDIYSVTYTNVDPQDAQEKQLSLFEILICNIANLNDEDYTKKSTVKINDIYKALDYTECNNCGALVYVDDCETDHYWTNDGDRVVYHICPECRESVEPISF